MNCACGSDGVSEADAAAVDVGRFHVHIEFADAVEGLDGKCFVELGLVYIVHGHAGLFEGVLDCWNGACAKEGGVDACDSAGMPSEAGMDA